MKVIWNILLWCLSRLSKGCSSCRPIVIACLGICVGCTSQPKYVEGVEVAVGLYIPGDQSLYGLQVMHYLSGCVVKASSNQTFTVERHYATTNSYFGIATTIENTDTKVEVKK